MSFIVDTKSETNETENYFSQRDNDNDSLYKIKVSNICIIVQPMA